MGEDKYLESNLNRIEKKIDILTQKHDFSIIQNSFLAIFFAILIFSITIILYHKEGNLLVWLISILVLAYALMILTWLLFSIFSNNDNNKFQYLGMVIFYLVVSGSVVLISSIYLVINSLLDYSLPVNNIVAVVIFIATILLILKIYSYISKLYYNRFKLLTSEIEIIKKPYDIFLEKKLKKYGKSLFYSINIGLFIVILSGLWNSSGTYSSNINNYGFPLIWINEQINRTPRLEYNINNLMLNWLFFTIILFIIHRSYLYLKKINFRKKQKFIKKDRDILSGINA